MLERDSGPGLGGHEGQVPDFEFGGKSHNLYHVISNRAHGVLLYCTVYCGHL